MKTKGKRKAMLIRLPASVFDQLAEFSKLTGVKRNDFVSGVLQ